MSHTEVLCTAPLLSYTYYILKSKCGVFSECSKAVVLKVLYAQFWLLADFLAKLSDFSILLATFFFQKRLCLVSWRFLERLEMANFTLGSCCRPNCREKPLCPHCKWNSNLQSCHKTSSSWISPNCAQKYRKWGNQSLNLKAFIAFHVSNLVCLLSDAF